jgi:hypothetical protein
MRLRKESATSLSYAPKLQVPLPLSTLVWLGRLLSRERVLVTFSPDERDGGETRVAVSGRVGRGGELLTDREFWHTALR